MVLRIIYMLVLGGWAAILSNRNIAVYHDGIRPVMGAYIDGDINKKDMIGISFAMSIGLIIGFGIPFSIASSIILIHSVLLATDVIGIASPNRYVAAALGGIFSAGLAVGLDFIIDIFSALPVNIMDGLSLLGDPVLVVFSVLPAIAIAYQFGYKLGLVGLFISGFMRIITDNFINGSTVFGEKISISSDGMALAVGMIFLLSLAIIKDKKASKNVTTSSENPLFTKNAKRIKKNIIPLAIMGGIITLGASLNFIGGSPLELTALQNGEPINAALVAFIAVIGYVPLILTTGLVSGAWATAGICDWLFGLGYLLPVPIAPIGGILGMCVEVQGVNHLAKFMDKYPSIRESGDHIRTAMVEVLEIALLVGSMISANSMAPSFGFFVVAGLYIINIVAGVKIVKMAVGPLAAILVGILANILVIFNLS